MKWTGLTGFFRTNRIKDFQESRNPVSPVFNPVNPVTFMSFVGKLSVP
jgi:hypothetical protein